MITRIALLLFAILFFVGCASPSGNRPRPTSQTPEANHAQVDQKDKDGRTALYKASEKNDTNTMAQLLARGANPNLKCGSLWRQEGLTPLHAAARLRKAEAVALLLSSGGNPNVRAYGPSTHGLTALNWAMRDRSEPDKVTFLLVDAGVEFREVPISKEMTAATHWAFAAHADQKGIRNEAVRHYKNAADWFRRAAEGNLGRMKLAEVTAFMHPGLMAAGQTLYMHSLTFNPAIAGSLTGPLMQAQHHPPGASQSQQDLLKADAVRCEYFHRICSARAQELENPAGPSSSSP
jgi:hypothetical protein